MAFCVKGLYAKPPPIIRAASVVHFYWTHIPSLPNLGFVDSSEWTKRICMSVILSCGLFLSVMLPSTLKILRVDQEFHHLLGLGVFLTRSRLIGYEKSPWDDPSFMYWCVHWLELALSFKMSQNPAFLLNNWPRYGILRERTVCQIPSTCQSCIRCALSLDPHLFSAQFRFSRLLWVDKKDFHECDPFLRLISESVWLVRVCWF